MTDRGMENARTICLYAVFRVWTVLSGPVHAWRFRRKAGVDDWWEGERRPQRFEHPLRLGLRPRSFVSQSKKGVCPPGKKRNDGVLAVFFGFGVTGMKWDCDHRSFKQGFPLVTSGCFRSQVLALR
jgi:hypothetical protein